MNDGVREPVREPSGPPSGIRDIAATIAAHTGREEMRHLGRITAKEAERFHTAIQGALSAPTRVADGIHPLLPSAILAWGDGPNEPDLMADGNDPAVFADVDFGGLRLMGGGQQLNFLHPVTTDTDLWMRLKIADVEVKSGRSGDFIALTLEREFCDADGLVHTTCRETFLAR